MNTFKFAIEALNEKIDTLKTRLSMNISDDEKKILLDEKREISNAIYWLKKLQESDLMDRKVSQLIEIPDIGYCDLRLVIDPESDDPNMWSEYKINGENILLTSSDIILKMK